MSLALDARGLKRVCGNCGIRFYDMNKRPVVCPACDTEFTGEAKPKAKRGKVAAAIDSPKNKGADSKVSKKTAKDETADDSEDDEDEDEEEDTGVEIVSLDDDLIVGDDEDDDDASDNIEGLDDDDDLDSVDDLDAGVDPDLDDDDDLDDLKKISTDD